MENVTVARHVPRPAATVMLVRPESSGIAVYMTRRSRRSRFMPAVHVFPGGAVDPEDRSESTLARLRGADGPPGPEFFAAALRELFEEAGILLACDERGEPAALKPGTIDRLRRERAGGTAFAAMLRRDGLWLDAREIVHYSNWITPESEPIRFDAHFFLARAPEGQTAAADAVEVHDGEWIVAAEALERGRRGEFAIIFPTRKHLERLAAFGDVDALFAHARARDVFAVTPVVAENGRIGFASGNQDDTAW